MIKQKVAVMRSPPKTSHFQKPAKMTAPKKEKKFEKVAKMVGIKANAKERTAAGVWYNKTATSLKRITPNKVLADKDNLMKKVRIGSLYMFIYDPKMKETLPYYDTFPVIFPIKMYKDGFLGINLHYLPPMMRAKLMDALYDLLNNEKMNDTTRLKISYEILNSAAQFNLFKPCVHRYLYTHVLSSFLYIDPENWDKAILLPLERFKKASAQVVWSDSKKKV